MMSERERFLMVMIYLLQREVEALRSVLSEYGADHGQYTQWCRAQDYRRTIEGEEYKL